MTPLTIAGVNLRRTLRDRTNAFFVVLFPLLMVMVLGLAFGGEYTPRVAVVVEQSGPLSDELVDELESSGGFEVVLADDRAEAVDGVETGRLSSAVVIPADYDSVLAEGGDVAVEYLATADRSAQQIGMVVRGSVDAQASRVKVARVIEEQLGGDLRTNLTLADQTAAALPDVAVRTSTTGTALFPEDLGRFDLGASSQLLLFVFVTSMTTATALIETRRLGVSRRMLSTPTRVSSIVAGEALGRIGVAVVQGIVIMAGSALLFGVSWGSPLGAAALMVLFATVAGGAGLLLGAVSKNPQQAIGAGLLVGLGLSALGGSMMPLEFFSPTMLTVAHFTPHAWAADGFAALVRHDGTVLDIAGELGVLLAYAAALFALGAWALRRRILRGD
ncbi:MAG: ABC transporter permease [Nocardioidaceae bacterium]